MKKTLLWATTAAVVLVVGVCVAYAHLGSKMMGQWGIGGFAGVFMVIFWGSAIAASGFLVKWHVQSRKGRLVPARADGFSRAIDILKKLYAYAEINNREFEVNKKGPLLAAYSREEPLKRN